MTDGLDALTITNQKARIKALEDENESLRKVVSDWIYLHSLVSRENKEKGQLLFAKDQTIERLENDLSDGVKILQTIWIAFDRDYLMKSLLSADYENLKNYLGK